MIIDAHVHLFAADAARFPLHPAAPYKPDPAPLEDHLKSADGALIGGAVLVHPEPYQDDHRYVVHCLKAHPKRFRATCLFDCHCPDSPARMAELVKTPGFVAARVHAYKDNHIPRWDSAEFKAFRRKAGELGLVLQIHMVPKYAGEVDKILADAPDFPVLIDHLGRPGQGTGAEHAGVLKLAARKKCHIKFSAVSEASKQPAPHEDVRPLVKRIAEAFGPERMIWGGSWGGKTTAKEYAAQMDLVHRLLDFVPLDARAGILGGNAAKLFGFAAG